MMKKIVLLLTLIAFMAALPLWAAPQLEAYLDPDTVVSGETFQLLLSTPEKQTPELQEAPDFLKYAGSTQSTQIVNGKRTETVGYRFIAPAPGDYEIPSLKVKMGKAEVKTPPLKLKVLKDDTAIPGDGTIRFQGSFGSDRTKFYVGEEIPLVLTLGWPDSVRINSASYPDVKADKVMFRDYRAVNSESATFAPARQSKRLIDGKRYTLVTFSTAFRPMAVGSLPVTSSVKLEEFVPDRRRRNDDFFGDFFGASGKRVPRTLEAKLPELTVEALPPAPPNAIYLGLVGDYRGTAELSADKIEAQEPLTLSLTLQSSSSFETLQVPKLELDGFRVYPGESEIKNGVATIRYALIPLQCGEFPVKFDFVTFAPQQEAYRAIRLNTNLLVTPSTRPVNANATPVTPAVTGDTNPAKTPAAPRTTLLYLKDAPGTAVARPWHRNQLGWVILFFLAGPVFFLLHAWRQKSRSMREADGDYQRRERAGGRKKAILRQIATCKDEDLPKLVTGEVTAYLSDRWALPPGATPDELAQKAHNSDLAEVLRQCGEASYLPPELAKQVLPDMAKVRKVIAKALKIALIAFLPMAIVNAAETPVAPTPTTWSEALGAYDRGDFKAAQQYFEERLKTGGEDPNVLYNLGCIAEAEHRSEKALWYLEKAHLAAPHDSAIQENCNVLRRKFFQPEIGTNATPQEMLLAWRDHWRPDHYLLAAAILWCALWMLANFRKKLPDRVFWSAEILIGICLIATALCGITQLNSTYQANRGTVIVRSAEVTNFPGAQNGRKIGALPGGTPVSIVERRQEYLHVMGSDLEGWVKSPEIGELP